MDGDLGGGIDELVGGVPGRGRSERKQGAFAILLGSFEKSVERNAGRPAVKTVDCE